MTVTPYAGLTPAGRPHPMTALDPVVDTETRLADLVRTADPDALADLRTRALAPLADLRPDVADRLAETLRSWLLHQGRREDVAADLVVHPQTVRYRMTQLRELYGDGLQPRLLVRARAAHPRGGGSGRRGLVHLRQHRFRRCRRRRPRPARPARTGALR